MEIFRNKLEMLENWNVSFERKCFSLQVLWLNAWQRVVSCWNRCRQQQKGHVRMQVRITRLLPARMRSKHSTIATNSLSTGLSSLISSAHLRFHFSRVPHILGGFTFREFPIFEGVLIFRGFPIFEGVSQISRCRPYLWCVSHFTLRICFS